MSTPPNAYPPNYQDQLLRHFTFASQQAQSNIDRAACIPPHHYSGYYQPNYAPYPTQSPLSSFAHQQYRYQAQPSEQTNVDTALAFLNMKRTPGNREVCSEIPLANNQLRLHMTSRNPEGNEFYFRDEAKRSQYPMIRASSAFPLTSTTSFAQKELPIALQESLSKQFQKPIKTIADWLKAQFTNIDISRLPKNPEQQCLVSLMPTSHLDKPQEKNSAQFCPVVKYGPGMWLFLCYDATGSVHGAHFMEGKLRENYFPMRSGQTNQSREWVALPFANEEMILAEHFNPALAFELKKNNLTIIAIEIKETETALYEEKKWRSENHAQSWGIIGEGLHASTNYVTSYHHRGAGFYATNNAAIVTCGVNPVDLSSDDISNNQFFCQKKIQHCDVVCAHAEKAALNYASKEEARTAYLKKIDLPIDLKPYIFVHTKTQKWAMDFTCLGMSGNQSVGHLLNDFIDQSGNVRQLSNNPIPNLYSSLDSLPLNHWPTTITYDKNSYGELGPTRLNVYDFSEEGCKIFTLTIDDAFAPFQNSELYNVTCATSSAEQAFKDINFDVTYQLHQRYAYTQQNIG